ncbi:MAG: hypothetical protein GY861_09375 [bacterium]|nr:hypothetical protein [bacterium]
MEDFKTSLVTYSVEKDKPIEDLSLTKLSETLIFTFNRAIETKKNLIVVYPESIFRPSVILGYNFMKDQGKDVLFFSHYLKEHLKNFCMLQEKQAGWFLWHNYLPCILDDKSLNIKLNFRKGVKTTTKKSEIDELIDKLENNMGQFNKLIFCSSLVNARKLAEIKDLNFEDVAYSFKENLGLCIFENLSLKIFSEDDINSFTQWLTPLMDKNTFFIFHFSNFIDSGFIKQLQEKSNSVVLYLTPDFLYKTKKFFYEGSNLLKSPNEYLSNQYIIESKHIYEKDEKKIELVTIKGLKYSLSDLFKDIHIASVKNLLPGVMLNRIKKVLFMLPRLSVHPSSWGRALRFKFRDGSWRHISILQLVDELDGYIKEKKEGNDILNRIKHKVVSLYNLFDETDRYKESHPFKIKSKPYITLEMVDKFSKSSDGGNIIVGVYDSSERRILEESVKSLVSSSDKISVRTIRSIIQHNNVDSESILILPSYLISRYIAEYFKPFKKIIILSYEGEEVSQVKKQMKILGDSKNIYTDLVIDSFESLYSSLNWKKDNFLQELEKFRVVVETETPAKEGATASNPGDVLDMIKERILDDSSLKANENAFEESQDEEVLDEEYNVLRKDYMLILSSLDGEGTKNIELPKTATLLYIDENQEVQERDIREIKEGDRIALIQGDERKSFIDYLAKRSGLEDEIDLFHIKRWKEKLNLFIEEKSLNENKLFDIYINKGGDKKSNPFRRWKDSIRNIAPQRKEDLKIIGEIIEYEYLVENIDKIFFDIKKLRKSHRLIGREINKIIRDKISGQFTDSSFDDFELSNKINIYRIDKLCKNDQKI